VGDNLHPKQFELAFEASLFKRRWSLNAAVCVTKFTTINADMSHFVVLLKSDLDVQQIGLKLYWPVIICVEKNCI
jgi:hypothetical protein